MASLATFIVSTIAGVVLGIVGVVATVTAVSPSAEHVAQTTDQTETKIYGTR